MPVPLPFQLPVKLAALRVATGQKQKHFAALASLDASQWCALERGRRRVASRAMLDSLLTRLRVSASDREELVQAFEHDRVIDQFAKTQFPDGAAPLVSRCLQASLVLNPDELLGLLNLVESNLASKQQLIELARRSAGAKEVAMD